MREMKYSGISWIGEIPKDWKLQQGKFIYRIETGKLDVNAEDLDGQYPFFTCSMFPKKINTYAFDCEALLVAGNGIVGYTQYYKGKFNAYQRTYVLSQFKHISTKYLKYYISNNLVIDVSQKSIGSVIQFIKLSDLKNFIIVYPNEAIQNNIVQILDDKCKNLDALIANNEAQIEKLKQYKQSLITEVVTRGLDPTVPMKDSGVEWIGKIPEHWKVSRIKNLFELKNERNDDPNLSNVNLISLYTDLGVVQHSDIIETTGNRAVTAEGYKIVHKNDIVVNIILCWMGAIGMSKYDGVTSPAYDVYSPKKDTISEYYHYLFRTKNFNGECYRYGRGIMMMRWRTYSTEFTAINIPEPQKNEQLEIINYLNYKCTQIDKLISIKQDKIEKLTQYKKSLIYEYVTGKKEV